MSPATTTTNVTTATRRPLPDGLGSKLAYLTRVLKTPTIGRVWEDLAAAARDANWSHEEYLTAVLERQVADRESAGTMMRVRRPGRALGAVRHRHELDLPPRPRPPRRGAGTGTEE